MLKFLLLEVVKFYVNNLTRPKQREKRYCHYFIGGLAVVGLIILIIADYIYIYEAIDYTPYLATLLIISTSLFLLAVIIKLVSLWLNRKERREEIVADSGGISSLAKDILPVVVSMIPVGIIAYVIWSKIQVKILGKKLNLKDSIKRLF